MADLRPPRLPGALTALRRAAAGCMFAALALGPLLRAAEPTRPDWSGDLTVFRRELPAKHKNLFFQTDRAVFDRALAALESDLPRLSDSEVVLRLQELTAAQGDDHTSVHRPPPPGTPAPAPLPLGLYWFSDGWRVTNTTRAHEKLLGAKVLALGGVPMADVESRLARLLAPANAWVVKSRLPQSIIQPAILRHYGLATDHLVVTAAADGGAPFEVRLPLDAPAVPAADRIQFRPAHAALTYSDQRSILWHRELSADGVFLLQYNRCDGREVAERRGDTAAAARLPSLTGLFDGALAELRAALAAGRVRTLVFDVRFNPGGASDFGTRFAEQVAQLPALRPPGRVFVILGRRTFSSAILNAKDFQRLLGATFVGEPAGGTVNHYGEIRTFTLPSSGTVVTYSTKYFGDPRGRIEPLRPDLPAELSFADFNAGRDPALDAVKAAARP